MRRFFSMLLMLSLLAFVPLAAVAQDKDKDEKPAAKGDEKPAAKADEKPAPEPAPTPKPAVAPAPAPVVVVPAEPTTFTEKAFDTVNRIAANVAPLATIFILAIIAIVLMGLRSDLNRMETALAELQASEGKKEV